MESNSEITNFKERVYELELQLATEKKKYELVLEYTNCGLWEFDIENKRMIQTKKLDGKWSQSDLVLDNFRETILEWNLVHPEDVPIFHAYCDSMENGEPSYEYELRAITDDDKYVWLRYIGKTVYNQDGKPFKSIGKTLDITKEKRDMDYLIRKASLDSLTHLYNKEASKTAILERLRRETEDGGLLIIVDIDDFKKVNDTWGHMAGDALLEQFAAALVGACSVNDVIGRVGGDEFIIYSSVMSKNAEVSMNHLMNRCRNITLKNGEPMNFSMGIARYPQDAVTYEGLYQNADIALYKAKRNGKAQCAFYKKTLQENIRYGETYKKRNSEDKQNKKVPMNHMEKALFEYSFSALRSSENILDAMYQIFSEIGLYLDVERVYLITYDQDKEKASILKGWEKNGQIMAGEVGYDITEFWRKMEFFFLLHDYFCYNGIASVELSEAGQRYFNENDIKSVIEFPIHDEKQLVGIMHFEDCKTNRTWTEGEVETLSSITSMLSGYLIRARLRDELNEEAKYTGSAMDSQKQAYYAIDKENYEIKYLSRYTREKYPEAKIGKCCYKVIAGKSSPCQECPMRGITEEQKQYATEVYNSEQDSWSTISANEIKGEDGKTQYLLCWTDITTFLNRVKSIDQLTGVYSYDKFSAELAKRIQNDARGCAVVFAGIHRFAELNSIFGYAYGDEILQFSANRLSGMLKPEEMICRIKGDDFILLLEESDAQKLERRVNNIFIQLTTLIKERFEGVNINFAVGVYALEKGDCFVGNILDRANTARKLAAEHCVGKTVIEHYTALIAQQEDTEKQMRVKMERGLKNNEFYVVYQPKVKVETGEIVGAEALLRWENAEGELVSTGDFIAAAERNGFIEVLDKFVYESVFAFMQRWEQKYGNLPNIAVNVSRQHLLDETFANYMYMLSEQYQIPRNKVELEITETLFFVNEDFMLRVIQELRDLGFGISVDDFGTGYSTLSMIQRLPIDILKIDGSFFYRNKMDKKNKSIISTIIHLAKELDYTIVCEGVETEEQMEYIKEKECDLVQGYYCYKPVSAEEFEMLRDKQSKETEGNDKNE